MEIVVSFGALVALTTGVVEALKRGMAIEKRFLPLVALIVGILLTFLAGITNLTSLSVITGIAVGLASCGLFDHTQLFKE